MNSETEYWKARCEAAERVIEADRKKSVGAYVSEMLYHYLMSEWTSRAQTTPPKDEDAWPSVDEDRPPHLKTVWLCNREKGYVWLGCCVVGNDGYHWAASNGIIYSEKGEIVAECESDDLDVTHFCYLPTLPNL